MRAASVGVIMTEDGLLWGGCGGIGSACRSVNNSNSARTCACEKEVAVNLMADEFPRRSMMRARTSVSVIP